MLHMEGRSAFAHGVGLSPSLSFDFGTLKKRLVGHACGYHSVTVQFIVLTYPLLFLVLYFGKGGVSVSESGESVSD